ncbi:MAG: trehalose synthase [Devosia sp.]|nr:trehalose synthase [Devosia sp.]
MTARESGLTEQLALLTSSDGSLVSALSGPEMDLLQSTTLPQFLPGQRWFGAKDRAISSVSLLPLAELEMGSHALLVADVHLGHETQRYLLPVSAVWGDDNGSSGETALAPVLAHIKIGTSKGLLTDSALEPALARSLLDAMRNEGQLAAPGGVVQFLGSDALRRRDDAAKPRPLGAEQSNVSIAFGSSIILKLYRRLRAGEQPDVEVARFLTGVAQFRSTPEFLGEIQYRPDEGEATTLAAAFAFVPNQGDAWAAVTRALGQSLLDGHGDGAAWIGSILGQRTAEMHKAFAVETIDPAFAVEPLQSADVAAWAAEAVVETRDLLDQLQNGLSRLSPSARTIAEQVLGERDNLIDRIEAASTMQPSGGRSRIHGDYHLGQVLVTDGDVMIIDFEGEPKRSLAERRAKSTPLRDVAGMLRSFHYAAWTALNRYADERGEVPDAVRARADQWRADMSADFVGAYETYIAGASSYPTDPAFADALSGLFLIHKAIYEVGYELANRPDWVEIPLSGIRDLLHKG